MSAESLEAQMVRLLVNGTVGSLVGGPGAARVYPLTLPQRVLLPAIRYQRIDTPAEVSQGSAAGMEHPRVQWTVHALSYAEAEEIASALKRAFQGRRGLFGEGSASFVANDLPDFEGETGQYLRHVDVIVWYGVRDG